MKHKHYKENKKGKDYVVGDLHGCLEDLLLALKALNFDEKVDRLFCVGDLVDRGPDSMGCAKLINHDWFHTTQGNHEEMMVESIIHQDQNVVGVWLSNGGLWSVHEKPKEIAEYAKRFEDLPLIISVGEGEKRFNVVHAELLAAKGDDASVSNKDIDDWTFDDRSEGAMLWGRTTMFYAKDYGVDVEVWAKVHKDLSRTFVGHTPVREPFRIGQFFYIDTGCVYYHTSSNKSEQNTLTIACPTDGVLYVWSPMWRKLTKKALGDVPPVAGIGATIF